MQRIHTLSPFKAFSILQQLDLCQMRNSATKGCVWSLYRACLYRLTYPVYRNRTLYRALAHSAVLGSDGGEIGSKGHGSGQFSYGKDVHPTRLHSKRRKEDQIFNSGRSRGQFTNRHKRTEDKYQTNYARSRQYTERPLEEEKEIDVLEESSDGSFDVAGTDPGDVFGTMRAEFVHKDHIGRGSKYDDEPDSDGEEWVRPRGRRNKPYWFGTQMKNLCKEGKLKEAIEMLEIRMLKEERVKPIAYNYNILIGACGRAGYTKMAFKLYNNMKKRGILPVDVTYTSLVNACAESPWPTTDGIQRLRKLHGQLQENGVHINLITCHALMKAYAKCGDFQMTFDLFRHLIASTRHVSTESCNFFFFACASDKEAGLTYAIQGWRYLLQRNIKPDVYTYNLLLRIARDCGIGHMELANRVLLQRGEFQELLSLPPPPPPLRTKKSRKKSPKDISVNPEMERIKILPINPISEETLEDGLSDDDGSDDVDNNLERKHKFWWEEELSVDNKNPQHAARRTSMPMAELPVATNETPLVASGVDIQLPNLLDASPAQLEQVVSLGNITSPQNRLALIGGCSGIIENMNKDDVQPNIKTFGLLTEMIPYKKKAERELMVAMEEAGVKGDIHFYNGLIRQRAVRRDIEGSKEILAVLHTKGLFPTLKTFGNLAIGCYRPEDGLQLIENMKAAGMKPNVQIFASLIGSANRVRDYGYITKLLQEMLKHGVLPNEKLLEKLETIASFHQHKAKEAKSSGRSWTRDKDKQLNQFRQYYITWLEKVKVAQKEHPWQKYRPDKHPRPIKDERD